MLEALHAKLLTDNHLSNYVNFEVKRKRQPNEQLAEKIRSYEGPDRDTKIVLQGNFSTWLAQPWLFWTTSKEEMCSDLDAQAQIVRSYVRARGDDA